MQKLLNALTSLTLVSLTIPVFADGHWSGFLEDYDQLEVADDPWLEYMYMSPNFREKLASAQAMVIEQPEIFIAEDSKYQGIKPDDMKLLADTYRAIFAEAMSDLYQIAVSPGPDTLHVRLAFTNVYLKKKGRRLIGYTPVGLVAGTAKRQLLDDFTDKIELAQLAWEIEILDSQTGERIGVAIKEMGDQTDKKRFTSWDELEEAMQVGSARLQCRFQNASLPENQRQNCIEITEVAD